jgi:hypothetical protein
MKSGDKVTIVYAVIPADRWDDVKLPQGSFAKAYNVDDISQLTSIPECKRWGAIIGASLCKLANKLCPIAGSLQIHDGQ